MIKTKWNVEAVKAYETGQGVELVNEPYPHYVPSTTESEKQDQCEPKEWVGLTDAVRYQWLRNEFAHGRETYLAEGIISGQDLDKYIDEQLIKKDKNT